MGGAQGRRRTIPPSWSTAIRSGSPRVHAACCSSAVTCAAVLRVSQSLRRRTTPPIFPLRTRARNLGDGGATRVPITTSEVLEKPVLATPCVSGVSPELAGPGLTHAVTTATAAKVASPARALFMATG